MLVPAIIYKDEIEKEFAQYLYTEQYFYYIGRAHCNHLVRIDTNDGAYQYAIIDKDENLIGYFEYTVDPCLDTVRGFGLFSFDKGNPIIGRDVLKAMEELVENYHRIEWRMVAGNPVQRHYDKFCKRHNGNILVLHDETKEIMVNIMKGVRQ
jgi:hypothetical protein